MVVVVPGVVVKFCVEARPGISTVPLVAVRDDMRTEIEGSKT
jgi:hypothetical protein